MKTHGFQIKSMAHKNCTGCLHEAESAAIMAKVTGSVGARHIRSNEAGVEHSARVTR